MESLYILQNKLPGTKRVTISKSTKQHVITKWTCFSERQTATNYKTIHLVLYENNYRRKGQNYANRNFIKLIFFPVQQGQLNQRSYDWLDIETGWAK
jgi:hypothetical protein